jgi:3-hydroxyisobutyrate dehydrogenase-like beta-hydroxyacid dehydrogenase
VLRVGVLGLGEAGSLVAADLVRAGADVVGHDPRVPMLVGVPTVGSDAEAAQGRDLVLSLTAAEDAPTALAEALPSLGATMVYADAIGPLGADVTLVPGGPGEAARRKLLRSVFYKGLAAAVVEGYEAAERAGLGEWFLDHVGQELQAAQRSTVARLVEGSRRHAVRREAEMAVAGEVVRGLGVPSPVSDAARAVLQRLARERGDQS